MDVLNFGKFQMEIFGVLAAVLHLGNVQFVKKADPGFAGDAVEITNGDGFFSSFFLSIF